MAVVLVLFGAIGNALALVLQRKAAQDSARQRGRTGSLRDMVQRPAWLGGTAIFAVAVTLQVLALSQGSVALVQPILVMELPFTLLLGWWILGGPLRGYEWFCVATMAVGLVVLLASLQPRGGAALETSTLVWAMGTVLTLAAVGLAVYAGRRSGPVGRAGLYGVAAGIGSGFVAVIVKAMADALEQGGLVEVFATWQTYLLLVVAPIAFITLQNALRAGRLLASQPGLTLGNPLLASLWGVGLLGEKVSGGFALVGGLFGAVLLSGGVVLLSRSPVLAAQEGPAAGPQRAQGSRPRVV